MSIENIPMSTLISDLNDINIVNNEEIYEDNLSKDDLNDIINNQSILDNNNLSTAAFSDKDLKYKRPDGPDNADTEVNKSIRP